MEQEYDGRVDNIDLPDPILLEVITSVLVESNCVYKYWEEAEDDSGNKFRIDIGLFEQCRGDEEYSDVPVIKYSKERFAPALIHAVRLKTPNYYRGLEAAPGLYDQLEGCRYSHRFGPGSNLVITPADGSGGRLKYDASGANKIDLCTKTFMYCTSSGSESNLLDLKEVNALFDPRYTHGSAFRSSKELARSILTTYGPTICHSILEVAQPVAEESFARANAWMVHGPVRYLPEADMGLGGIASYFTKPDIYRNQNEYRFWLGFSRTPVQSDEATISLPIPEGMATAVALK